jgi:uncharacterized protein
MNNLFDFLSEEEIEELDQFLIERLDEDADTEGKDEGVLDISELDGLFTAIISGPVVIPPSRWLPVVWGDFEPVWDDATDLGDILSLMIRHMNSIAAILTEQPEDFEPIFFERKVEDKSYTIVDEWCHGYMQGVALAAEQWNIAGQEMINLLTPIMAFTSKAGWEMLDKLSHEEIDFFQQDITPNVRKIHAYWLDKRKEIHPPVVPRKRETPGVGRNDPCPCGSGRKYKKCCLH